MIFAGMSGSALADAGGLGQVEIKAMTDQGYKPEFAVSLTAASATIGPIIPPSITMIVYAGLAEESIGRLFLGGCIPGILMGISLMLLTVYYARKHNFPKAGEVTRTEFGEILLKAFPPLMTPVIIFGGIILGVFTVTEAAAAAALYAFLLGWLGYREITLKALPHILVETMIMTSVIMFVLSAITGISWILVDEQITVELAAVISSFSQNPTVVLTLLIAVVLVLGCVLEGAPIMVLCVPVMLPIIKQVGISGVHFGVVFSVACMVGMITPPVGMVLFVISEVSGLPLEKLMRAVIPFVFPLLVVLAITIYIPITVMFLPDLLMNQ
jgi:tripartite ATP-independent transporter DctM subunit